MVSRRDASLGASAFTLAARELVLAEFPNCVVNVGDMHFDPGAFNIIPEHVTASLEFRAPDERVFAQLDKSLIELARQEAARFNLGLEIEFLGKHAPAPMNGETQKAILKAARTLDLAAIPLASGAGHDAQSLADLCPTGMIFVPSIGGISHSPKESTEWQDCVNGANLLLQTVLELVPESSSSV